MLSLQTIPWVFAAILAIGAGVAWWLRRRLAWRRDAAERGADLELLSLLAHPRHFSVTSDEYRALLRREQHALRVLERETEPPRIERAASR